MEASSLRAMTFVMSYFRNFFRLRFLFFLSLLLTFPVPAESGLLNRKPVS